jgi:hypothetical protein
VNAATLHEKAPAPHCSFAKLGKVFRLARVATPSRDVCLFRQAFVLALPRISASEVNLSRPEQFLQSSAEHALVF